VKPLREDLSLLEGYGYLDGAVPVVYSPGTEEQAAEMQQLLETGVVSLSEMFDVEPSELEAFLVADEDWDEAPRESVRAYPLGLPYFTRSVRPPALVLPATLSPIFRHAGITRDSDCRQRPARMERLPGLGVGPPRQLPAARLRGRR
jgi:hypothetical protein